MRRVKRSLVRRVHHLDVLSGIILPLLLLFTSPTTEAQTWSRVAVNLSAACWIDSTTVAVAGENGTMLRSDDAGSSWHTANLGTTAWIRGIRFVDSKHGFAFGQGGLILRTTDGGTSWSHTISPIATHIVGMAFPSIERFIAVSSGGSILESSDGGSTWDIVPNSPNALWRSVAFADTAHGTAVAEKGAIATTSDGGRSWLVGSGDPTINYLDIAFKGDTGIIVGNQRGIIGDSHNSYIRLSSNAGESWSAQTIAVNNIYLERVHILMDGAVVATGDTPVSQSDTAAPRIARSTNGGRDWTLIPSLIPIGTYEFQDLGFADANRGIVVGTYGSILLTADGGKSWRVRAQAPLQLLPGVSEYFAAIRDIAFLDADTGIAVGNDGYGDGIVMRTTDAGITWNSANLLAPPAGIALFRRTSGFGIPGGGSVYHADGFLYSIRDAGATWARIQPAFDQPRYNNTSNPYFFDGGHGLFAADSFMFETADGGGSWHTISVLPGIFSISSLHFVDQSVGFCIGDKPEVTDTSATISYSVFKTTDVGRTWEPILEGPPDGLIASARFLDRNRGFASMVVNYPTQGQLLRTLDGGAHWDTIAFAGVPYDIRFFNDTFGIVVGSNALVAITHDAGMTWEPQTLWPASPGDSLVRFSRVDVAGDGKTVIIGGFGILVRGVLPKSEFTSDVPITRMNDASLLHASIAPNPVLAHSATLHVGGPDDAGVHSWRMVMSDLLGRTVMKLDDLHSSTIQLPLNGLAAGAYQVTVISGNRQETLTLIVAD